MSSLPLFKDIGKEVRDLFEKNFHFDMVKMEMKNMASGAFEYQGNQKYSIKDGKMVGELEAKYETSGFTLVPKLTTESALINCELKVNRPELKGIDVTVAGAFHPHTITKTALSFGALYRGPDYNIEVGNNMPTDAKGGAAHPPAPPGGHGLRANGVFNLYGWTVGASGNLDPNGMKLSNCILVGGFKEQGKTSIFVNCDPHQKTLSGTVHNVINANLQTGLIFALGGGGGGGPSLQCCASYILNDGASVKTRINSDYLLGMAYTLKLKPNISVTLCSEIDAQKLKQGGHKMGFGVEFS